jgi:hypothetical protein
MSKYIHILKEGKNWSLNLEGKPKESIELHEDGMVLSDNLKGSWEPIDLNTIKLCMPEVLIFSKLKNDSIWTLISS